MVLILVYISAFEILLFKNFRSMVPEILKLKFKFKKKKCFSSKLYLVSIYYHHSPKLTLL